MADDAAMRSTLRSVLVMAALCLAPPARAGGFWLYEAATPDVGVASAGRYASALDAGTVLANPAGMTRLKGRQFLAGFQTVVPRIEFDVDESGFGGGDGGDAGETALVPALYYSHSVTENFKLGLALGSYFGAGIHYDDDWAGRYYVEETSLLTAGVFPGAAYRLTDWLSVGGTVNLMVAELDQKTAVNNQITDPGTPDGQMKGNDTESAANALMNVGTQFGILFIPSKERVLVRWAHRANYEVESNLEGIV